MMPIGYFRQSGRGARVFAILTMLWLTAIVLPCAKAEPGCPMHDDSPVCVAAEGCAATAPDCAVPAPMLSTVAVPDMPAAPAAGIPAVVPTVFVRDVGLRTYRQRYHPRLPPANLHLQSVRLLI